MKFLTKILGCTLGASLMLASCDLEREPNNYIDFKDSYLTLKDAEKWDNGIYSTLRGKFGGGYILPQEIQADMLNAHAVYGGLYGTFHSWTVQSEDEAIKSIYHSYYAALVDVNIVLETAPKLQVVSEEQKIIDRYLGNAYFARAYYNFSLAIRWGTPYNAETEATDLCVPLETKPFNLEKPSRATNKEVYSLILDDLSKAEEKLADVKCAEGTKDITKDAVRALRARVYLYMGNMQKAFDEASALIAEGTYKLIPALAGGVDPMDEDNPYKQMWQYDSGVEQIWQPFVDKPNEVPTTTDLYGADMSTWQYWADRGHDDMDFNKPSYLPSGSTVYSMFDEEGDRRIPAYFEYVYTTVNDNEDMAQVYVISKFKGNPKFRTLESKRWGGYVPNGICAPKPFRIAEQYLIAAEAGAAVSNANAIDYLNDLRESRGLSRITAEGDVLRDAIRKERSRELAYEGFRLWDLRRWNLPIDGRLRQGAYPELHAVGSEFFAQGFDFNIKIESGNDKFIWGFPKDEVAEINKNIIQNQGW